MANKTTSLIRQRIIDKKLRGSWGSSIEEMMDACNDQLTNRDVVSSKNTIRNDLNRIMNNFQVEIVCDHDGKQRRYHYKDPEYSIYKIPLNEEEQAKLTQTLLILSHFDGMPQFEWLDEYKERFKSTLQVNDLDEPVVGFDENVDLKGRSFFSKLFSAINNKQVLELTYHSFRRDEDQRFIVHPYYLKEYTNRWFLICHTENREQLSVFALDRIVSVRETVAQFIPLEEGFSFKDYFFDMIGVTKVGEIQKVLIWIAPHRWPYVKTKPIHGTQKVKSSDDTGTVIQIEVYLNHELEQKILSFGKDAKVLEPEILRNRLKENIRQALENYEKD